MPSFLFKQNNWYLGAADLPIFVSQGMLAGGAEGYGFDRVRIWDGDQFPLPPAVVAPGDYDTVALAHRFGPDRAYKLPDAIRWIYDLGPGLAGEAPVPPGMMLPPPQQETGASSGASRFPALPLLAGAVVIGGTFVILRWRGAL